MKNDKKQRHEKSADVSKTEENFFNNENRILFSIEEKNMYLTNRNYKNLDIPSKKLNNNESYNIRNTLVSDINSIVE